MINRIAEPQIPRDVYLRSKNFLDIVRKSEVLTPQQKRTLRGQALHGDLPGAERGLKRIMEGRA